MPFAIIFLSGGAILALELLASRIMTPYFGVSLYIWTGILSITLISLALGYWWGGRLAAGRSDDHSGRLGLLFALMPALAGLAIVLACAIYPHVFQPLARWSLVGGAFIACLIFLFLPLVTSSAMNPLLVALLLDGRSSQGGDGGAGRVFFVSTLGSVAGVIVTAFALIPNISNFSATLLVAAVLGILSLALSFRMSFRMQRRGLVRIAGGITLAVSALLIWQADEYTGREDKIAYSGAEWRVEATRSSLFGTVKILRTAGDADGRFLRMYFHDGLIQNTVDSQYRSISFYTYALEALTRSYAPSARQALMLGLGAGIVPGRLARSGIQMDVVEIDPVSVDVAQRFFGFDNKSVNVYLSDARTFVDQCTPRYDVALVDLFNGDGTPDYLITRDFFRSLRQCLKPGGIAVFNTFANLENPAAYRHLLATLKSELPEILLFQPDWPGNTHINSFLVASAAPLPEPKRVTLSDVPAAHGADLWDMLAKPRTITAEQIASGKIIRDAWNAAAMDIAADQSAFRQSVIDKAPPALLVN